MAAQFTEVLDVLAQALPAQALPCKDRCVRGDRT